MSQRAGDQEILTEQQIVLMARQIAPSEAETLLLEKKDVAFRYHSPHGECQVRVFQSSGPIELKIDLLSFLIDPSVSDASLPAPIPSPFGPPPNFRSQGLVSRPAIVAACLGLFSVCLCIPAPFALIAGLVALRDIKDNRKSGLGWAILGLVLGSLGSAVLFLGYIRPIGW
jgi:hypothetical protein